MTAGRFFLISPPMEGSKLTHQTSRRFMCDVLKGDLSPLYSFFLSLFVPRHLGISRFQIGAYYMWAHQLFDEFTDLAGAYRLVKALINFLVHSYCQFFLH